MKFLRPTHLYVATWQGLVYVAFVVGGYTSLPGGYHVRRIRSFVFHALEKSPRLLEFIGNIPLEEAEARYYAQTEAPPWRRDSNKTASTKPNPAHDNRTRLRPCSISNASSHLIERRFPEPFNKPGCCLAFGRNHPHPRLRPPLKSFSLLPRQPTRNYQVTSVDRRRIASDIKDASIEAQSLLLRRTLE